MRRNKAIILAIVAFVIALPLVISEDCPHGIQPLIHMQFVPNITVTTVGSNIQIYCNASTVGLKDIGDDRLTLTIRERKIKQLKTCEKIEKSVECKLDIKKVSHSDAKDYICLAQVAGGSGGCSFETRTLEVKDCSSDKDGDFNLNAVFTENMTILYQWKYILQKCDLGFRVYWSNKGPVDINSSSKELPLNVTSWEVRDLEVNSKREYWVGMAVETTKGRSKIYRVQKSLTPVCTSNKDGRFSITNASLTKNNTIFIYWKYKVESCDEGFVVFWSSEGPVSKSSKSTKLSNKNITFFQLTDLEPDKRHWIGMVVATTNGPSEIYRFSGTLMTTCTRNKDGRFSITNASLTNKDTILIYWKYKVESCDEGFVVFWSSEGPVSRSSKSRKLSNKNITFFELTNLEPNERHWIGMAVVTASGLSEIYRFSGTLMTTCTSNKDGRFSITNASLTKNNTIFIYWKYKVESCDEGFVVFWSSEGPVSKSSKSRKLSNKDVTSFELTNLEPNESHWIGMAVVTASGLSEIYRFSGTLMTTCTSNKDGRFSITNASLTKNNTIFIYWKYKVESCDEGFVVFWSSEMTVSKSSKSRKLSNKDITFFELTNLEPNERHWIGMAVATASGLSEIYTFNGTLITRAVDPNNANRGEEDVTTPVVIFIVLTVCLIAIACIAWLVVSRRKRKLQDTMSTVQITSGAAHNLGILYPETESQAEVQVPPLSPKVPLDDVFEENEEIDDFEGTSADTDPYLTVLDEWEVSRELLSVTRTKLGTGQFGLVRKGTFRTRGENGQDIDLPVAVKVLKENAAEIDRSDLLTELRILKFVNSNPHPNILKLIGACTSEEPISVITEYCSRGNLKDVLKKYREILNGSIAANSEPKLTHEQLLHIAVNVACGMEHLTSMKFVHRDLAARNILVTESWIAKISDFGLARETSSGGEYVKSRRNLLPVKWTAIEALVEGKFTSASDVWSFGVLLWEISNIGGSPYKGISPHDVMTHVGSGGRLEKPDRCSPYLYSIMKECWETWPEKRPSFTTLHQKLSAMLEESEDTYINVEFMDGGKDNEGHFERYTSP